MSRNSLCYGSIWIKYQKIKRNFFQLLNNQAMEASLATAINFCLYIFYTNLIFLTLIIIDFLTNTHLFSPVDLYNTISNIDSVSIMQYLNEV